jgi:hypothetical protein
MERRQEKLIDAACSGKNCTKNALETTQRYFTFTPHANISDLTTKNFCVHSRFRPKLTGKILNKLLILIQTIRRSSKSAKSGHF